MKTPAGKDCRYYYEDLHRGRNRRECRLIQRNPESQRWEPGDCSKCTVPEILHANASPNLEIDLKVVKGMLGLGRRVEISTWCIKHDIVIDDPYVGCLMCAKERPGLEVFFGEEGE